MISNANQKAKTLQLLDTNAYCYMINVVHITDDASTEPMNYFLIFNQIGYAVLRVNKSLDLETQFHLFLQLTSFI